jgi:hypothetical protein
VKKERFCDECSYVEGGGSGMAGWCSKASAITRDEDRAWGCFVPRACLEVREEEGE